MANEIRFRNNGNEFKIIQSIDNEPSLYTGVKSNNGSIFVKLNENIKNADAAINGNIKRFFNLENVLPKNGIVNIPNYQMVEPAEFTQSGELIKKGLIKFGQVDYGTIDLSQRVQNVSQIVNQNVKNKQSTTQQQNIAQQPKQQNVIGSGNIFSQVNSNLMHAIKAQQKGMSATEDFLLDKLNKHKGNPAKIATYLIELAEYQEDAKANGNPIALSDRAKNAIKQSGFKGIIEREGSDGNVHKYMIMDDGSQYRMKTPVSQTQQSVVRPVQPIVRNTVQQPKPNVVQSVQTTQQQTNANAEKLKAWRDTPRYSGVTSATARPFKPISMKNVPASNVAASMTVGNIIKPSLLSKIGKSKLTSPALLLASIGSEFIPGANNPIPEGTTARSIQDALSKIRIATGTAATAGMVASYMAPNPWVWGGTAIASGVSALSGIGEGIIGAMYGEEPAEQTDDGIASVNTKSPKSLHGEDDSAELGYGVPSGDEMSYQDIFDNLARNKINYEAPVSSDVLNKAIKNTVFSSIGEMMGQNTSGGIRGDVVFNNTYNKQLNTLLNIRDTLNNAEVGSDQYRLAGIASNAMLYGQDVLNSVDSNFNKDIARVNSIMKIYSKQTDNSAEIQKYDTELKKTMEKRAAAIAKVEADIAENSEKADNKKIFRYSEQKKQDMLRNAGASYDPVIADYKNRLAQAIARGNAERRIGSSTTMTAKGKAIVDMWNSLPSKDVDITDDHIEYIASKAKLNDVQKKALEATIIAESGGRSSSINESDGDSASVGIIQWNGPRANDLIKSARDQKANPKDAWFQAKYISSDLRNPSSWSSVEAMNRFFTTNSQKEANKLLTEKYIRPADSTSRVQVLEYYQTKL